MALFAWDPKYSVSIAHLDDQHKKLFALIDQLHNAMAAGKANEMLDKVLVELITYCKTHFEAEEKLMKAHNYPSFLQHKLAHDTFADQAKGLYDKFKSGNTLITLPIMNMLKDWLTNHIKGQDQAYAPYFAAKGVK